MSNKKPHVKTFAIDAFIVSLVVSVTYAIICMLLNSRIGLTTNASILGALIAMAMARISFRRMQRVHSLGRQNLVRATTPDTGFAGGGNQYRFTKAKMRVFL